MLLMTLIIVAVLLFSYLLMSSEQVTHVNRAAMAMFSGVTVWVLYLLNGGEYIQLVHPAEYSDFLNGAASSTDSVKTFIASHVVAGYLGEACSIILFLIATNTVLETMHNNGVFDPLVMWLRMRNSRVFLWLLSLLTFVISANVDNLTTVVLMMGLVSQIVRSRYQKMVYVCAIMVAATLGGCITVIGDMTSLLLWNHGNVTPTAYSLALIPSALASLCVFNALLSPMLVGRVEVVSLFSRFDGDDSSLSWWQKGLLLVTGIAGLWFIPTFHAITKLPPTLGALCLLALVLTVEGLCNLERNKNVMFVQRHYFRNAEFINMRIILYFIGISLGVGALAECGALQFLGQWLQSNIDNVYAYGGVAGLASVFIDNVPLVMAGMNMFSIDGGVSEFALNGIYWPLMVYCCEMGGCILFVGTLSGQAVLQVEHIRLSWLMRHYAWRVILAWLVGMGVFWFIHM